MRTHKFASLFAGGILLASSAVHSAFIDADIVWVIDDSASMGADITEVKSRIVEFNTEMTNNGINAHYGLVSFGGSEVLEQNITDFATFNAPAGAFQTLLADDGNPEDGSAALQLAMTATFRAGSVRNFIVVTDEDDDVTTNRPDLLADLAATGIAELINIIGNPNDDSNGFYDNLATSNGGQFFNILDFRNDPAPFFTNFIATKVEEIKRQGNVPVPGLIALLGLGLAGLSVFRRRS